ncbi:hypothetical protein M2140_000047 [Clostridiales Family XIII bacterium PM5-7]
MARRVKCKATGEYGGSDVFVKIGSSYYKSQKHYEEYMKEKEYKKQAIEIILYDFLDYKKGQPFPTSVQKKYSELSYYSNYVILCTVKKVRDSLLQFLKNKNFDTEYGKISYVFSAIVNNANEVNKKVQQQKELSDKIVASPSFDDMAEVFNEQNEDSPPSKYNVDITRLL